MNATGQTVCDSCSPAKSSGPLCQTARAAAVLLATLFACSASTASGATYLVSNAANAGSGSLRAAIESANANPGPHTINFNIPGSPVITLTSELPAITQPVFVNGASQPGYKNFPLVTLQPASSTVDHGLVLGAAGSTVSALRVQGFMRGIWITSAVCVVQSSYLLSNTLAGVQANTSGNRILQNYFGGNNDGIYLVLGVTNRVFGNSIGVHPLNGSVHGNQRGILVSGNRNFIGGTGAAEGNVISGNSLHGIVLGSSASSNNIQGNLIGTDASGRVAVPNSTGIKVRGNANRVGGVQAGAVNIISGNLNYGIYLGDSAQPIAHNMIENNYIGTDITGFHAVPNRVGIFMQGSLCRSNRVGTGFFTGRNTVSGNTEDGIRLETAPHNRILGNYIGTDTSGLLALGNAENGIYNENSVGAIIGGTESGAGNVISGNGGHGIFFYGSLCEESVIQGNRIGVSATGSQAVPNRGSGIRLSRSRSITIGGSEAGAGNLISGNLGHGIYVSGTGSHSVVIQGNRIGTTPSGLSALGNAYSGIILLDAPSNLVGGVAASAGNIVAGNHAEGIVVSGVTAVDNQILSNRVGVDTTGQVPISNRWAGIKLENVRRCRIGGDLLAGGGNRVSANGAAGIWMDGADDCDVIGNWIGGHFAGVGHGGNAGAGIYITGTTTNNRIGGEVWSLGNFIAYNGGAGVAVGFSAESTNTVGNRIDVNWIHNNVGLGIDLGNDGHTPNDTGPVYGDADRGPNNLQNYPAITNVIHKGSTLQLQGIIRTGLTQWYKINFYGNTRFHPSGYGEGEFFLGSTNVFTAPLDTASFDVVLPAPSPIPDYYSATAIRLANNDTSEFSAFAMLDSDGDGMPDGWEYRNFGSPTGAHPYDDPDRDGASNLEEYLADTDPNDPDSVLRVTGIRTFDIPEHQVVVLQFPSSAYRQYCLEWTDPVQITTNGWVYGSRFFVSGTGEEETQHFDLLPADTPFGLFRIRARLPR